MTAATFIDAVQGMVGLRPDIIESLVLLSPHLTDEERATALTQIAASHEKIKQANAGVSQALDEEIADMTTLEKKTVRATHARTEEKERASAESILDASKDQSDSGPPVA